MLVSGLPDFRGAQGFWRAYPPLQKLNISLSGMSNPEWFDRDPQFAWGFFGHRYNLYKNAEPHEGFKILLNWGKRKDLGYFAFTSNVDGHFQRAGFDEDKVIECHGTINYMQMADTDINDEIWPVPEGTSYNVDMETLRLQGDLPQGPPNADPTNQALARPNILMFGDWGWQSDRTDAQYRNFHKFRSNLSKACAQDANKDSPCDLVVVEIGAGLAVPTVRIQSEELAASRQYKGVLIRINPNEPQVPSPKKNISLPMKGLEALKAIDKLL